MTRSLLRDLVETPSVSGDEAAAAAVLVDFFESHDREVRVDAVGNVRAPADDSVLLTSHVDTVPGDIEVRVEDDTLYGRGSVDAKGPLAAMATAAVETGASFVGVVGEERDSRGARHLVANRDEPDAVVNGEPSGWDAVTLGYRGLLPARYEVETPTAHGSLPEPNAIDHATAWWENVRKAFAEDADSVFETVTPTPLDLNGGTSGDGLSVDATLSASFRLPPETGADDVKETLAGLTEHGSVSYDQHYQPVMASARTPVAGALRAAIREEGGSPGHVRKTGTSDMNVYAAAWDCPMATYGPGDSELDHTPNEHLNLAEYDRSVRVLSATADRLCTS